MKKQEDFPQDIHKISETAEVHYKATESYNSECEKVIAFYELTIKIDYLLIKSPILSKKDLHRLALNETDLK